MGVLSPKPIAAVIRFIPNSIKATYSKRPNIKRKPQKRAVYVVNQEAKTINNLGILFPSNIFWYVSMTTLTFMLKTSS